MEKNVGGLDRTGRLVAGPLLIAVGVAIAADIVNVGLAGTIGLAVTTLVVVAGAVFLVTGTTRKCPANGLAGVDTFGGD